MNRFGTVFRNTSLILIFLFTVMARPAAADHTVYLDFETRNFNLRSFDERREILWDLMHRVPQPLNTPELVEAVKKLILMKMCQNFAAYEINFVTVEPRRGRFTRVIFGGVENPRVFGGDWGQATSGLDSWWMDESTCHVFTDEISNFDEVGTWGISIVSIPRIANAIGWIASHEVGHILGLDHEHAYDDHPERRDPDVTEHIMATGEEMPLTAEDAATNHFYFSPHISDERLMQALQGRAYYNPLQDVNGDGRADLVYGRYVSPGQVKWYVRRSEGDRFGDWEEWCWDAGDAGDIFLLGDVDGDGRADLVYGRTVQPWQVIWYVRRSLGDRFDDRYERWRDDAGDAADIFRLADVNGDGRADLVYGRANMPDDADHLTWYVRLSEGDQFGDYSTWRGDGLGARRYHYTFFADVDNDRDADMAYVLKDSGWWEAYVNKSMANAGRLAFGRRQFWGEDMDHWVERFFIADLNRNGAADLLCGRPISRDEFWWYGCTSDGNELRPPNFWNRDAGDEGDYFRVGDVNGDRRADLLYSRRFGRRTHRWYGRLMNRIVAGLRGYTTWSSDAGDDGDIFP